MITLQAVRLVGWHFFEDATIRIGEATLFAGDNGSGKSTIVDAIQYALAANLGKVRFNAAAGEKKAGRSLDGYVRGKTGADSGEYLRGDSVAHVMLQFDRNGSIFCAGICAEAFQDEVQAREYPWIHEGAATADIAVRNADDRVLSGREFRDRLRDCGARVLDSKRDYNRELTMLLGVFRRNAEFNPWLEALVRSVSFSPLTSVDRFVCDYILDDRPVDVSAMKANLESYKEAEREADSAVRRVAVLSRARDTAAEWAKFERVLILQEYVRLRAEHASALRALETGERRAAELRATIDRLDDAMARRTEERARLETARREAEAALATNDAYRLRNALVDQRTAVERELSKARADVERYKLIAGQCAALLGRALSDDIPAELTAVEAERDELGRRGAESARQRAELENRIADAASELADLERGLPRYPAASIRLKDELEKAGLKAWIFAELLEVLDPDWQNATEGWLNTLRFAVLTEPDTFQRALEVYDGLPREVAGAALPNLARMRGARASNGSLAKLVGTESPYARLYADYILGEVMTATIATLKDHARAVTRECMSYSNHTANRIREEVYGRWYLGRAARERRLGELRALLGELRAQRDDLARQLTRQAEQAELLRRASTGLHDLRALAGAAAQASVLAEELATIEADIAVIDLSGVRELEARLAGYLRALAQTQTDMDHDRDERGRAQGKLEDVQQTIETDRQTLAGRLAAVEHFSSARDSILAECQAYWEERAAQASPEALAANYETAAKSIRTRQDQAADQYRKAIQEYNASFNALLEWDPALPDQAVALLRRLEDSELPAYREKIAKARGDAERQFKEHFVARLNEYVEDARESFKEINETLRVLSFGRDQYRFTLEERAERRGQLDVIRKAAAIESEEGTLFAAGPDSEDRRVVEKLFERILHNDLDSIEVRSLCDYRTYFSYDIKMKDTSTVDPRTGKALELSLARVIREKSGGEAQTPYYVAIAASFYRFFKDKPEETVRLALFDEAFNRMDDERIGRALEFFRRLGMQVITAVPTEKLETIAPWMDSIALVIRHGYHAVVHDYRASSAYSTIRTAPADPSTTAAGSSTAPASSAS
jgi:uncharacterized protein YPO0396